MLSLTIEGETRPFADWLFEAVHYEGRPCRIMGCSRLSQTGELIAVEFEDGRKGWVGAVNLRIEGGK